MTGGRVVVLGPTGRNFAAGMSGGIAFVYDPDRSFIDRVNLELVEVEPLGPDDVEWYEAVVARHAEETGSTVAARLLANFSAAVADTVKVVPRDYRRVLEATARAQAEGTSVEAAVMASAHG